MTRLLIGLLLTCFLLGSAHAQSTTTSTSSSTTSTSTSTSTSSTSNTVPCVANGLPCALDANCCSGICNDFGVCQATSTTSTSTSSTTTTSTSLASTTSTSASTTTTSTSSTTTTTIIVYDPDGALFTSNGTNGATSLKWLRFDPVRPQAIMFHAVTSGGTATVQIEQSLDGGTTWTKIGNDVTVPSIVTYEHPTGLMRGKISACSSCSVTLWWSMQKNP